LTPAIRVIAIVVFVVSAAAIVVGVLGWRGR
jgi:hypothetical protein